MLFLRFWGSGAGLKCWFSVCLYGSLVHSGTEVSLSCGLSGLLIPPGFWWLLGVKLPFLPVCSSTEILLVMRTLLYATQMNPLSVREPVSTKLLGSEALHFLLPNRNVNTMQFSFLLNGCIALKEFLAGSAIIASIQCCCSPHCVSSKGHMLWTDQGYCFICMKHHLLGMNAFAPVIGKSDFSLMCEAALQKAETLISDLTETTGRKWTPGNICLSLIFVVISHTGTIGQGNLI